MGDTETFRSLVFLLPNGNVCMEQQDGTFSIISADVFIECRDIVYECCRTNSLHGGYETAPTAFLFSFFNTPYGLQGSAMTYSQIAGYFRRLKEEGTM